MPAARIGRADERRQPCLSFQPSQVMGDSETPTPPARTRKTGGVPVLPPAWPIKDTKAVASWHDLERAVLSRR